jgi:hypothetical protein
MGQKVRSVAGMRYLAMALARTPHPLTRPRPPANPEEALLLSRHRTGPRLHHAAT